MGWIFKGLQYVRNEEKSTEIRPLALDLDICTDNFTLDKLGKATKKMKPNKSPGTDFVVSVETLKFGGNEPHNTVLDICIKLSWSKITVD